MDGKNYSAVPPPPSLTSPSKGTTASAPPLDFNDALSKARAIAEKLKQQSSLAVDSTPAAATTYSSGTKRGYNDDDNEEYRSSTTRSYGSYQDERESKRSAYDSGSSKPSYGSNDNNRRFGLGSEERKPSSYGKSSYGGGAHQEEYSVPNHMVGLLIGKGGENLKKIERMSGVSKVQFSNDTTGPERQVHLTGEPDQISIARDMIRQMVEDAQNNDANRFGGNGRSSDYSTPQQPQPHQGGGGGHTITIKIPVAKVGLVIGRGGETIRDFEERSKAKILIASDGSGDVNNERTINLVGEESAVQQAKSFIEDIVYGSNNSMPSRTNTWGGAHQPYGNGNEQQQQQNGGGYGPPQPPPMPNNSYGINRMGRPDDERIFVTVPASSVGLIIGRGGETVRSLQEQSGARVKIDPTTDPNSEERTVNISGDPKCVAIAKQLVEDKVAEASRGNNRNGGGGYHNKHYNNNNDYSSQQQQYNQYYGAYDQSQYPGYQYDSNENNKEGSDAAAAAYYAQYYGGQQATPEQQQAYYQWYQQYYGASQQYASYEDSTNNNNESFDTKEQGQGQQNVDGEPIQKEEESKKEND